MVCTGIILQEEYEITRKLASSISDIFEIFVLPLKYRDSLPVEELTHRICRLENGTKSITVGATFERSPVRRLLIVETVVWYFIHPFHQSFTVRIVMQRHESSSCHSGEHLDRNGPFP
ncbi:hypothetical protein CUC08_Gglean003684 [Alternaria sp. MG1]|nr:hypothetical protein CUC08_Gglean003684 [Alternaria sp. MG1]